MRETDETQDEAVAMTRSERMCAWLEEHARALEHAAKLRPELTRECAKEALRCLALAEMSKQLDETNDDTLDLPDSWWTDSADCLPS